MIMVYLYSPHARISAHRDPNCTAVQQMRKPNQRVYQINNDTISAELRKIQARDGQYQFASTAELNDMWLAVDFQDEVFEKAVVRHVQKLLSLRYESFHNTTVTFHRCAS